MAKFTCSCRFEHREMLMGSGATAREAWEGLNGLIIDRTDPIRTRHGADHFRLYLDGKEVDRDLWDPMSTCQEMEYWLSK